MSEFHHAVLLIHSIFSSAVLYFLSKLSAPLCCQNINPQIFNFLVIYLYRRKQGINLSFNYMKKHKTNTFQRLTAFSKSSFKSENLYNTELKQNIKKCGLNLNHLNKISLEA